MSEQISKEYEFSTSENAAFLAFMKSIILLSISLLISGVIILIVGVIPQTSIGSILTGIIFIVIGLAFLVPLQSFLNIILTEGNDMEEFFNGLRQLGMGLYVVIGANVVLVIMIIISYITSF